MGTIRRPVFLWFQRQNRTSHAPKDVLPLRMCAHYCATLGVCPTSAWVCQSPREWCLAATPREREFFIDNLLVRIHFIIVMIRWTGLALWEF